MPLSPTQARTTLAALRLTVGGAATLAPRLTGKVFGIDADENPQAPLLGRLFGLRNAAIGLDLLDAEPHGSWPTYNIAIDALDAVAIAAGGIRGYLPKRTVVLSMATALAAGTLAYLAAQER